MFIFISPFSPAIHANNDTLIGNMRVHLKVKLILR